MLLASAVAPAGPCCAVTTAAPIAVADAKSLESCFLADSVQAHSKTPANQRQKGTMWVAADVSQSYEQKLGQKHSCNPVTLHIPAWHVQVRAREKQGRM